jgi:hypothetical protein
MTRRKYIPFRKLFLEIGILAGPNRSTLALCKWNTVQMTRASGIREMLSKDRAKKNMLACGE